MRFTIVFAILVALVGIAFAMQNNVPVTVSFFVWRIDSSLAVVLLTALALGAIVVALMTTPATLKRQWLIKRQKRRIDEMEKSAEIMRNRLAELETPHAASQAELDTEQSGYVGLKQLITGRGVGAGGA